MSYSRNFVIALVLSTTSASYAQAAGPKLTAKEKAAAEAEAYAQVKFEAYAVAKAKAEAEVKAAEEEAAKAKAQYDADAAVKAKEEAAAKADEQLKERGRQLLRDEMKDPDSTKFRNEWLSANRGALCGEYNSKNGHGGFAGFSYFYVVLSTGGVATPESYQARGGSNSDFVRAYNHNCK